MILRKLFFGLIAFAIYFWALYTFQNNGKAFLAFLNPSTTDTSSTTVNSNTIQVALLLDTSGSMSGLIEQAKSQLWNILNELARTVKNNEETTLEIALYEYGNPNKATKVHQINQLTPFTTDMDLVSQKLFSLTTSGGDEYCGMIIKTSLDELEWENEEGLRIIYIAGNEEFTQGEMSYVTACAKAQEKGISINTIYCGDYESGIREFWKKGAQAGGGDYMNIDHNQETVYIKTPYDEKINQLNEQLNQTYIPYGEQGKEKSQNQKTQDANSANYSSTNAADRAVFKSSKKYKATDWDLIDAYKKDKAILKKDNILPDSIQALSIEELERHIEEVSLRRGQIQTEIQELDKKRRDFKTKNTQSKEETSLQKSMIETIKKQAEKKGFKVKD